MYRLGSAIWWTRLQAPLHDFLHPNACGGIPGKESYQAALAAQLDVEEALLTNKDLAFISTDYYKFFDTFDHKFSSEM